jgi:hypothetical protein
MDEVVGIPTAGASQPPSHADGPTNLSYFYNCDHQLTAEFLAHENSADNEQ